MSKASFGSGAAHGSSASGKVRSSFATMVFSVLRVRPERNHRARQAHMLNDFMLKDIGVSRADILAASHGRGKRHG
ncbi:MAG: hypothetical protein ACOZAM_20160 [Pseudomonadota bacterium]